MQSGVTIAWLVPLVVGASALLTHAVRRYALARSLLDVPNARSSHSVPTPRGGGVAIVVSSLAGLALLAYTGMLPSSTFWALLGAGSFAALIGFLDDHRHIAGRWRLLTHFLAAAWALAWLGGAPPVPVLGQPSEWGWFGFGLATVYLVWLLNLYNFMDGIDGIASAEAVVVGAGGALLYWLVGQPTMAPAPLILAAAAGGFLVWNVPPARIFMGDAGSGYLGMIFGVLSLQAAWIEPPLFWSWVIMLGVFIVDATLTLLRRLIRGEKVYEAHRSHAYQHASRRFGSHLPVTLAVAAIGLFWLLPMAIWVGVGGLDGIIGTVLAYAPLVVLTIRFHAGEPEVLAR